MLETLKSLIVEQICLISYETGILLGISGTNIGKCKRNKPPKFHLSTLLRLQKEFGITDKEINERANNSR